MLRTPPVCWGAGSLKADGISLTLPEMHTIAASLEHHKARGRKCLAVLVDPDSGKLTDLDHRIHLANRCGVDYFFVGGSMLSEDHMGACLRTLRSHSDIPVILFPGNVYQVSDHADAILYLSLLSGRNPDYLIGKQVEAAMRLAESALEVIATAYLLIEGGHSNTAAYLSQTQPIPRDKPEIAVATAVAAQLLRFQWIYLEAGSGAQWPVPLETVRAIAERVQTPIIVGGGLRKPEQLEACLVAGADLVVVGNALERDPELLREMSAVVRSAVAGKKQH
jgi:phosphoglycerol geranylgeranyltransferase